MTQTSDCYPSFGLVIVVGGLVDRLPSVSFSQVRKDMRCMRWMFDGRLGWVAATNGSADGFHQIVVTSRGEFAVKSSPRDIVFGTLAEAQSFCEAKEDRIIADIAGNRPEFMGCCEA